MTDTGNIYDMPDTPDGLGKLWERIENDLGMNDMNMSRDRPYCGQPHTDTGMRGSAEIHGITFRDLHDCFIRAFCLASGDQNPELYDEANKGENAALCENDIYKLDLSRLDPMAVFQNMSCEVEKIMGIYPNISPPN
jgi:hypothetical protein